MNAEKIILAGFPGATDLVFEQVILGMTPYPCGSITAKQIYKAAKRLYRANANGITLCDYCDNKTEKYKYMCDKCKHAIDKINLGG